MAQMHGGRRLFTLFFGLEYVKGRFLFDLAPVFEIEHPFRICKHALFIRIHRNRALVLGWWRKSNGMEKTLLLSLRGRVHEINKEEIRGYTRPETVQPGEEEGISPFRS
jgi:hypothetical protein